MTTGITERPDNKTALLLSMTENHSSSASPAEPAPAPPASEGGFRRVRLITGLVVFGLVLGCSDAAFYLLTRHVRPENWHQAVTAVGCMGLTLLVSVVGLLLERGRRRAIARMEQALNRVSELNARLEKVDAEKNEFLAVAAHDLKNPLNIVMGFAELIAGGRNNSSERDRDNARYIIEAAERMITLISQLADVNAIEQRRFPLEIGPCDLGRISSEATASFAGAAQKKQISIYAAGPLMPAWVVADSNAARRILDNLLSNAIKFSAPGSDVFVRMRNLPDAVVWEVQDQGPGVTEADRARLFLKFAKLSARPTAGESSTGLGLCIAWKLAEAMNGTVECGGGNEAGATFALRLPLAEKRASD